MSDLSTHISYLGVFVTLVLTGTGLPIPEEVPVLLAGAAAHYGELNPWLAFVTCVVGAVCGDCVMYFIGHHWGYGFFRDHPFFARLWHVERFNQVQHMFHRHGLKVLVFARFLVGIRGPVYLASGILRVPFRRFILVDSLSATSVVGVFFSLSYFYARHMEQAWKWIREGQLTLTVIVVLGVAAVIIYYWRRHRKHLAASPASEASPVASRFASTQSPEDARQSVAQH
jgi:membrane protein DedA with SNARE-associated domain